MPSTCLDTTLPNPTMHRFIGSEFFNFEFLRILSMCSNSGCEMTEASTAVTNTKDGDEESWSAAFHSIATRTEAFTEEAAQQRDKVAARNAYLRAASCYRASQ